MKVILFGASGTIGYGVLLATIDDPRVTEIVSVGRRDIDIQDDKLRQVTHTDFEDFSAVATEFDNADACFWALGVSSVGMDEADYVRITYGFTVAAAKTLHERSPDLCFCFVSGQGTDETESSRTMWARVKGKAENAVRQVGFRDSAMFRPGFIMPAPGFEQRIGLYKVAQPILVLFNPLLRKMGGATSSIEIGKAMINVAAGADHKPILDSRDINELAAT